MSSQEKLVSIGLPTFNRAKVLRRAVDSLLAQTYRNFELIISDNASSDETQEICRQYAARDPRVRYVRQKENIGAAPNNIFVLREARGEYFLWTADDDWWAPEYVASLVEVLENHSGYGVALCSFQRLYPDGRAYDEMIMSGDNDVTHDGYFTVYKKIFMGTLLNHFIYGLFIRKLLMKFFDPPLSPCSSWEKIIVSEMALATHFYSVKPMLRFVTQRERKWPKISYHSPRFPGEPLRPVYFLPRAYARTLFKSLWRVMISKAVPLHRKALVIFPLLSVLWFQRKRFIGVSRRDLERLWNRKILKRF